MCISNSSSTVVPRCSRGFGSRIAHPPQTKIQGCPSPREEMARSSARSQLATPITSRGCETRERGRLCHKMQDPEDQSSAIQAHPSLSPGSLLFTGACLLTCAAHS